jgi:hypothetical protein
MFDTSDLSVTGSSFLHLLPEILVERKKLTYNPTLSLPDDDIVYILVVKMNSCLLSTPGASCSNLVQNVLVK